MISAILDADLDIRYLLSRYRDASALGAILDVATVEAFHLLFADGIAREIRATLADRPELPSALQPGDLDTLMDVLQVLAQWLPALVEPISSFGRDPKDDDLIAHALAAHADDLVGWDKVLRDLLRIDGVEMGSPPEFLTVLREAPDGDLARTESA